MADVPATPRDKWSNKIEFVFSCIGLSVGLGNIWRFPYIAYENGGGAFLIPYIILLTVIGRPMYYMELCLGQFSSYGTLKAFGGMPLASGVGCCMMYACAGISLYYNVVLGYALTYLYFSFWKVLPWSFCDPSWADEKCYVRSEGVFPCNQVDSFLFDIYLKRNSSDTDAVRVSKESSVVVMVPMSVYNASVGNCTNATVPATEQFFFKRVIGLSPGIEHLGGLRPELSVALVVAWIMIFFCVCKGIKSSGKVAMFTAFIPFVILGVLLVRGVTLDGASAGLEYYFTPKWEKIIEPQVWKIAASQVFFSLSVAQGMIICLGSYNQFRNQLTRDVYIIAFADLLVSFFGGIVVFSVLGNMAHNLGVDVTSVIDQGFSLAFVAYPQAVSLMSFPHLWSVAFFVMLFFLALDSEFALVEGVLTPLKDAFPALRANQTMLAASACFIGLLVGLPMTTEGGLYILHMIDTYVGSELLGWTAVCEAIALSLCYGVDRFSRDIEFMLGEAPGTLVKLCWKFVCPIGLTLIFGSGLLSTKRLAFGKYVYPLWANTLAILLAVIAFQMVPTLAMRRYMECNYSCSKALEPLETWGPMDPEDRRRHMELLAQAQPSPGAGVAEGVNAAGDVKPDQPAPEKLLVVPEKREG